MKEDPDVMWGRIRALCLFTLASMPGPIDNVFFGSTLLILPFGH